MHRQDLQFELAFYRRLEYMGILYFHPKQLAVKYPDVLFFIMYVCNLLLNKKLSLSGANAIQSRLNHSPEEWLQILNWEEGRPYTPPCKVTAYRGYARSAMTSSLYFRKNLHFRFGCMGFGFFSNKRHFDRCACGSVFGLMETIYRVNSSVSDDLDIGRRVSNSEQIQTLSMIWKAASAVGHLELGKELYKGNWRAVAIALYRELTEDDSPICAESPDMSTPSGVSRVIGSLKAGLPFSQHGETPNQIFEDAQEREDATNFRGTGS